MKFFVSLIKSFFLAPFIIYIFNIMAGAIDSYIPINIYTIVMVGFLGMPGLVVLVLYMFFVF